MKVIHGNRIYEGYSRVYALFQLLFCSNYILVTGEHPVISDGKIKCKKIFVSPSANVENVYVD